MSQSPRPLLIFLFLCFSCFSNATEISQENNEVFKEFPGAFLGRIDLDLVEELMQQALQL